jgi:hypothetical protein
MSEEGPISFEAPVTRARHSRALQASCKVPIGRCLVTAQALSIRARSASHARNHRPFEQNRPVFGLVFQKLNIGDEVTYEFEIS